MNAALKGKYMPAFWKALSTAILLLCVGASAQTPKEVWVTTVELKTARESTAQSLKEYDDWWKAKYPESPITLRGEIRFYFKDVQSGTMNIADDGTVTITGISAEDAAGAIYASMLQSQMRETKREEEYQKYIAALDAQIKALSQKRIPKHAAPPVDKQAKP